MTQERKSYIDLNGCEQYSPQELKDFIRGLRSMLIDFAAAAGAETTYTLQEFSETLYILNELSDDIDFVKGHAQVSH